MKHAITFTKATGAGNDFIIVENLNRGLPGDIGILARALCSRHFGIGADGLLLLEPSTIADFAMLYFNADGSYGGMCGNGGRCLARYAYLQNIGGPKLRFEALDHVYEAEMTGTQIKLKMKNPSAIRSGVGFTAGNKSFTGHFINTGAPHVVIFTDDIETLDVNSLGRLIREHEVFAPEGTNVNFVRVAEGNHVSIRTYERGVENETLACGTGSVASAIMTSIVHKQKPPITVHVRSGEELLVTFDSSRDQVAEVYLQGNAVMIFTGKVLYDDVSGKILEINPSVSSPISIH